MENEKAFRKPVDGCHRVGLPQEIWKQMSIREGDKMDIWVQDGIICMRKAPVKAEATRCLIDVMEKLEAMQMEPEQYAKSIKKLQEVNQIIKGI